MPAKFPVWVLLHWQQTTFISSSHGTWGIYNEAGNSHTLNLHDEHQCDYSRENVLHTSYYLLPWAVLIFKHLRLVTATQHVPYEWIIQL